MKNKFTEVEQEILKIGIKIARMGEGAMFVFGDNLKNYDFMVNQEIKPFNILNNPKTAQSLALQDGFVWISSKGLVMGYGMLMKKISPVLNSGTRHASAVSASRQGNKVFVISQEEQKIKVFIRGKIIMQIDALDKDIEKNVPKVANVLESTVLDTLASFGALTIATAIGITFIPGVVIFGSTFALIKLLRKQK